jgi:succinyl-diaminopimelate desuccinylase
LRFGEKGPLWLEFAVRTKGAHGAYTHASKSATALAAKIIGALEALEDIPAPEASNLAAALDEAAPAIDRAQGAGAARITRRVTVNPGVVRGGFKVNMVASDCTFEVDIRLPNGLDAPHILAKVDKIVAPYPEVSYRQILYNPPSWCPPDTEMAQLVRANAREVAGIDEIRRTERYEMALALNRNSNLVCPSAARSHLASLALNACSFALP